MGALNRYVAGVALVACWISGAAFAAEGGIKPASLASPDMITLADATRMAQATMQECAKRGQPTSVLVMDGNGFQRLLMSDDNAKHIGVVHIGFKAAAVLDFKASTAALRARLTSDKPGDKQFAEQYGKDPRYIFDPGALPIYRDGKLVAVIAVGGSGNFNEDCAQAGVKALSWATTEPKI